jgi:hypothetical protein
MIISRIFAVASFIAVAALTVSDNAAAATNMNVGAGSGAAFWPGDAVCFGPDGYGGVYNACSGAARPYVVHIPNQRVGAGIGGSIVGVEISGSSTCAYYQWVGAPPAVPNLITTGSIGSGLTQSWSGQTIYAFGAIEVRCNVPFNSGVRSAWVITP